MKAFLCALIACVSPAIAQPLAVSADEMSRLAAADVVIIGEVHDNPSHHATQAQIVEELQPAALVVEMLIQSDADALAQDPKAFAARWAEIGWPDFQMYLPIFDAVRSQELPGKIVGGAVPRDVAKATYSDGVAAHFAGDAVAYGLTETLPKNQYAQRIELQFAAHCEAMPREMLGGMIEVQRLRDATLAAGVMKALADTDGQVVVITGNGHARKDWGVPAYLARVAPELKVISIGQGEDGVLTEGGFDIVLDAPAPDRPDPCDQFK
ncbi:ChaN family lipoprotein [Aliiroseovarius sp. F20344]|uniref:ChaN family lipoprotein n=1 Tax=Aliiroseovarius sp. F20344 TaxID=2926414 RepID=UPI001FF57849|nr:ChaN family lipoprotein [Aliiroseovarius sp. F20344]MCK0141870.1 ChaN family lipoprotein [Aliiroseovarius sp. F20344]